MAAKFRVLAIWALRAPALLLALTLMGILVFSIMVAAVWLVAIAKPALFFAKLAGIVKEGEDFL